MFNNDLRFRAKTNVFCMKQWQKSFWVLFGHFWPYFWQGFLLKIRSHHFLSWFQLVAKKLKKGWEVRAGCKKMHKITSRTIRGVWHPNKSRSKQTKYKQFAQKKRKLLYSWKSVFSVVFWDFWTVFGTWQTEHYSSYLSWKNIKKSSND